MANWKKVIVSGSNAELNHVTSSATISCSGAWFGGLEETDDQTYLVILDRSNGEFKYRALTDFPGGSGL